MIIDPVLLTISLIIIYILILLFLRKFEIGKKLKCDTCTNCCPDCQKPLNRTRRNLIDKIIFHIAFRIFDLKRYSCSNCGWEGLKWEGIILEN